MCSAQPMKIAGRCSASAGISNSTSKADGKSCPSPPTAAIPEPLSLPAALGLTG